MLKRNELIVEKTSILVKIRPNPQELLQYYANGIPKSLFYDPSYSNGTNELKDIFQNKEIFSFPKPVNLIKHLLQISVTPNNDDIILDFFAGSGTSAQAVMELNAEDNGNRQFILVQLDEVINPKKNFNAYEFCKNTLNSKEPVISDITIERVKKAGEKYKDKNIDIGYKVYSLIPKPEIINDKDKLRLLTRHISPKDIALNLALSSGKTLDKELKVVVENKLYFCEDSYYLLEIDNEIKSILKDIKDETIYIDAYSNIDLEDFLNLGIASKERLNIID